MEHDIPHAAPAQGLAGVCRRAPRHPAVEQASGIPIFDRCCSAPAQRREVQQIVAVVVAVAAVVVAVVAVAVVARVVCGSWWVMTTYGGLHRALEQAGS
jgi:hypothetical protein